MMSDGILVVDDTSESLRLLTGILVAEGYAVRPADSGVLALASALANPPALILLDIRMPGLDGYEVCRRLKESPATCNIPVVFISAAANLDERVAGLSLGAVDYITKPYQREELLARVRTHIELARLRTSLDRLVLERTAELKEALDQLRENASFQRQFLHDVLASVTDGVLVLCYDGQQLPCPLAVFRAPMRITDSSDLYNVRQLATCAGKRCGLSDERIFDMINGIHEAAMNAVVHVGSGLVTVSIDEKEGRVQARIEDKGPGIALDRLPRATLMKGYTTAGTFGYGMKIMLSLLDRVYLCTGSVGTTVVIEQGRNKPDHPAMQATLDIESVDMAF
ncbi:MAG: response regulator [Capsulimonadaceae bacterium]|nr:response regulator [Capsulimonadaceae bacterium]